MIINKSAGLAYLQSQYTLIQNINVFITFLRIMKFFTFSKKLSTFSEILGSAKFDILFFVLMFAIVSITTMTFKGDARLCYRRICCVWRLNEAIQHYLPVLLRAFAYALGLVRLCIDVPSWLYFIWSLLYLFFCKSRSFTCLDRV